MMDKSLFRNGRAVLAADVRTSEERYAEQAAETRAKNRDRLRMDDPAVDPARISTALLVFVRGAGWRAVERVNGKTVTVYMGVSFERVPFSKIVDVQ